MPFSKRRTSDIARRRRDLRARASCAAHPARSTARRVDGTHCCVRSRTGGRASTPRLHRADARAAIRLARRRAVRVVAADQLLAGARRAAGDHETAGLAALHVAAIFGAVARRGVAVALYRQRDASNAADEVGAAFLRRTAGRGAAQHACARLRRIGHVAAAAPPAHALLAARARVRAIAPEVRVAVVGRCIASDHQHHDPRVAHAPRLME
jgi:hypothetical protein